MAQQQSQQGNLSKEQIYGRRVWNLMHSTSAYYPEVPTEEEKQAARQFVNYFMEDAIEYPSWGKEFLAESEGSVDVESR